MEEDKKDIEQEGLEGGLNPSQEIENEEVGKVERSRKPLWKRMGRFVPFSIYRVCMKNGFWIMLLM